MKKIIKLSAITILFIINLNKGYGQKGLNSVDSLTKKINFYGLRQNASVLFTFFDKTVYVNNENVWFTTYLLNYVKETNNPTILSVALINDYDKSIALEQKFNMVGGLSFGHVIIPDSIPPGDYSFIVYTNILKNGIPEDIFVQAITIKTASEPPFSASLKLFDSTGNKNAFEKKILLTVETIDHLPIHEANIVWHIGDTMGRITSVNTNIHENGKYLFSIPSRRIIEGKNVFYVSVSYNKDVREMKMAMPIEDKRLNIKFYPEGGSLTNGIQSRVGWEAKNKNGDALKINGILYRDNIAVDTLRTDRYGMGMFELMPILGSRYEFKVISGLVDSSYLLPPILTQAPVITLKKAITNDSLQIKLVSKYPQKYFILIHNFRKVFYAFPVTVNSIGKNILVNLSNLPKGLATVTVFDSLLRPCAERLFFAHFNKRSPLSINIDQSEYTPRQRVKIRLRLDSTILDSIKGIVSVACVQSSRNEIKKANDIESYYYLKSQLEFISAKENYMAQDADDKDYLEKVLLIKGWRKYNWIEMQQKTNDSLAFQNEILLSGCVTNYGKPLKRPINLMVKTDSITNVITTDKKGNFQLSGVNALTAEGKKVYLLLNYGEQYGYSIKMVDLFKKTTSKLISDFKTFNYSLTAKTVNTDSLLLLESAHIIHLKEVKIFGRTDKLYNEQASTNLFGKGTNECGDYVCIYNILNCVNHRLDVNNRPAIIGQTYGNGNGGFVAYLGCTTVPQGSFISFYGVNYSKMFYGSDYSLFNPTEPEHESTIYWKHLCFINSKKDTELTFYTSDITGSFDVIVQGVASNGLIYEKKLFNVIKK